MLTLEMVIKELIKKWRKEKKIGVDNQPQLIYINIVR